MLKESSVKNKLIEPDHVKHKKQLLKKRAREIKEREVEEEIRKHEGRFSVANTNPFIQ